MASAFKWKLTNNLFSYLTNTAGGQPQINSGYTASEESDISEQVISHFGSEQAYADQFEIMKGMIASNPATSGVTLLNYIYYYDMDENSCGLLNGGGGGTTSKGEKGDKGDPGERGPQGPQGIQGIQGRGISNITTTPLTGGTGNRVEVILTDGTTEHFDVMNGSVDYEYLQTLVESAVTIEVQNVSAYVKNSIVQYVSGELSSFTHIIQDASSITAEVVSRVSGLSMDMSKLQMTATAITATVVNLSGDVSTMTQSIQTASGIAWSAQQVANSANSQCAQLKFSYSAITSQVEQISSGMVTHSEITQLAERITLNVYNELNEKTGINIEDGAITLDAANTNITGRLSLLDANSGFVLFDNGKPVISITNEPIGNDATASWDIDVWKDTGAFQTQLNSISDIVKARITLRSGMTYNINSISCSYLAWVPTSENSYISTQTNISYVYASLYIKRDDDSTMKVLINNQYFYPPVGGRVIDLGNDLSFTSDFTGNGYIVLDELVKFGQNYRAGSKLSSELSGTVQQWVPDIIKIGSDGLLAVNDGNKIFRVKNDEVLIQRGNNSLQITDDKIIRHIGAAKGDIGSMVKVRIISPTGPSEMWWGEELGEDEGFIIVTGDDWQTPRLDGTLPFYLPNMSESIAYEGRIVYIKNLSNRNIMFGSTDVNIMHANNKTPSATFTLDKWMCYLICGNGYWFVGYCG